jgi:hypothetical protein
MKKFTVLFLAGLLILAFGATAYAQAPKLEFRASGFIDAQTFWGENVPQYQNSPQTNGAFWGTSLGIAGFTFMGIPVMYGAVNPGFAVGGGLGAGKGGISFASYPTGFFYTPTAPAFNKMDTHWESRAHLKFDAIMGPNLSGTIYFEIDAGRWGAAWQTGIGNGREANAYGGWTTDRTSVEVKNIYIDVGLPYFGIPVPITVRVGAQPIGVRPAMLVYSDGTGVTAGLKIDPVLIAPIYAKMLEANDFQDDDADIWGLHVNAKLGTFTVGGYGLYYRMNSYPLWQTSNMAGLTAAMQTVVPGTNKAHMWWLGAYMDGKAGPVNLNLDFVYDFGWVKQQHVGFSQGIPHVRYWGWAGRAKIDYPWDKFNFGVVGMYATGADAHRTSADGLPGSFTSIGTLANVNRGYVVPPGSEQGPGNGESMVVYSMEGAATGGYGLANRANYAGMSPGGFGGTWFAKLYGSVKATPWWKVTFQGLYIGDTVKHGNALGSAFRFPGFAPIGPTHANTLRDDKEIGWEVNLINEFQIYNNLRFFTGFGYLIAGDATDVGARYGGINVNRHIANPWAFRTRLQYTF